MPRGERGLTLIEMLAVLAIIGIAAGVAVLSIGGGDRSRTIEAEAQRLSRTIQLAAERAMVTGHPLALAWDEAGYAYVQWNGERNEWEASGGALPGERHLLPDGMRLASDGTEAAIRFGGSAATPFTMNLTSGTAAWTVRFDGLNVTAAANDAG